MRNETKADFPQPTGEKNNPAHLKQQQLLCEGPPRSKLSVPVDNYITSVTDTHCCQNEFDGCATGTDSPNHL